MKKIFPSLSPSLSVTDTKHTSMKKKSACINIKLIFFMCLKRALSPSATNIQKQKATSEEWGSDKKRGYYRSFLEPQETML